MVYCYSQGPPAAAAQQPGEPCGGGPEAGCGSAGPGWAGEAATAGLKALGGGKMVPGEQGWRGGRRWGCWGLLWRPVGALRTLAVARACTGAQVPLISSLWVGKGAGRKAHGYRWGLEAILDGGEGREERAEWLKRCGCGFGGPLHCRPRLPLLFSNEEPHSL